MKFIKYFIFIFTSFLFSNVYAESCSALSNCQALGGTYVSKLNNTEYYYCLGGSAKPDTYVTNECQVSKCPPKDYPAHTYFNSGTKVPTQVCQPASNGQFCKYVAKSIPMITNHNNNRSAVTLYNVSESPVPSCTPLFDNQCDTSDPYGGCYTPPKDGCTRQANGSIICPDNVPPPDIKAGCKNGANYCNRPPEGCGPNYVSGKFNGQAICVRKGGNNNADSGSPETGGEGNNTGSGSGSGDGEGSSSGSGSETGSGSNSNTSSSTSTSTSTSSSGSGTGGGSTTVNVTNNNTNNTTVNVDVNGIISAIKSMSNSMTDFLNDINQNTQETNNKLDSTNNKIDTTNNKLDGINNNINKTNDTLDKILNKDGTGDGKDYTGVLEGISEKVGDISEKMDTVFSDEGKENIEKIGTRSDSPIPDSAINSANNSLNNFANKLTFSSTQCIQDLTVNLGPFGSVVVPLSEYCELMALIKIFLHFSTLMLCLRMFDATVRAL